MVPVRLRGHHFLCILTYRGFGYTKPFVDNMTDIVGQIEAGRPVVLCEGPDDICGGFTAHCRTVCDHDCAKAETAEMDIAAIEAVRKRLDLGADMPLVLDKAAITQLREGFADGSIRKACIRCSWNEFCTEIAAEDYSGVKLFAPD
jgi:hypothetical protein